MIKFDKGCVSIVGSCFDVLAEFGTLAAALYEMMCEKGISKDKAEELVFDAAHVGIRFQATPDKENKTADEIVREILKGEKDNE